MKLKSKLYHSSQKWLIIQDTGSLHKMYISYVPFILTICNVVNI